MSSTLPLRGHLAQAGTIAYGCMGLGGGWNDNPLSQDDITQARQVIDAALEAGMNVFDHADIYTFNKAEAAFGEALKQAPALRDSMYLQSKCGIRFDDELGVKRYDFAADWVTSSVEGSLRRLNTEQLDVLLLHRPDPLMELDELGETLNALHHGGKIAHVGVSNMNQYQIAYLQSGLSMPIVANQLELSLAHLDWLNDGVLVNTGEAASTGFTSGTLEYCRSNNIQLQAWGCLAQGKFSQAGLTADDTAVRKTTEYVMQLAEHYNVPCEAIVLAFLLRHPASIQPVIGTTNLERIAACGQATRIQLTREQWYNLYVYSRGQELP